MTYTRRCRVPFSPAWVSSARRLAQLDTCPDFTLHDHFTPGQSDEAQQPSRPCQRELEPIHTSHIVRMRNTDLAAVHLCTARQVHHLLHTTWHKNDKSTERFHTSWSFDRRWSDARRQTPCSFPPPPLRSSTASWLAKPCFIRPFTPLG